MIPEQLWLEWVEIQKRSLKLINKEDYSGALQELDSFLGSGQPTELESEIFGFRGIVKEEQGEIEEAKQEYLRAHQLSAKATYNRYTLELTLGRLCKQVKNIEEATSWYLRAAQTASEDPRTYTWHLLSTCSSSGCRLSALSLSWVERLTIFSQIR